MWLSFMISNRRSFVPPPNNPSALSARPSSCRAPVQKADATRTEAAPTPRGSPIDCVTHPVNAAMVPVTNPTKGQHQAPSGRCARACGAGSRVSKPKAEQMSLNKNPNQPCVPCPFVAVSRSGMKRSFPVWLWRKTVCSQGGVALQSKDMRCPPRFKHLRSFVTC